MPQLQSFLIRVLCAICGSISMVMDLPQYKIQLDQLPYGKRLHTAPYLYHDHDHEPGTKTTFNFGQAAQVRELASPKPPPIRRPQ